MNFTSATAKHFFGLVFLSVATFTTLWALLEKLSFFWGRSVHLSYSLPPLDLGFASVILTLNPGAALGLVIGVFLFWLL